MPTPPAIQATLPLALQTFVHGFAFTRSFTHPFVVSRTGDVWIVRDGPGKKRDPRVEEYVASGVDAKVVHGLAKKEARGRYVLCPILPTGEPEAPFRTAFKQLGYKLRTTEPVMVHDLKKLPHRDAPATIERVLTQGLADRLAKAARSRQILPEHLTGGAPMRQYVALRGEAIVGWVRTITVGQAAWCSKMYVVPEQRRQGIGSALLARALRDDRDSGLQAEVLTASHTGAKLYFSLGFQHIGTLYLYGPPAS